MEELKQLAKDTIEKYPHLQYDVLDLFALCVYEIEQGESRTNEIQLCYSSILDLIDMQK